ncbi:TPA: hypothetical protein DEF17_09840 [bacterium]|nr:hypothetical protein [bacterium]
MVVISDKELIIMSNLSWKFKDDGKIFEITGSPKVPWSHVITNGKFGSVWTERGGAFAWCGNSLLDRLTRFEQDIVLNSARRYIYLLDSSGIVRTLTPSPIPGDAVWRVEYGPGVVTYYGECSKYKTRLDVVVLPDINAEMQYADVESVDGTEKNIRLCFAQDILLGTWPDTHREFHKLFIRSELADSAARSHLVFTKVLDTRPGQKENWNASFHGALAVGSAQGMAGFETDRCTFYGYAGSVEKPILLSEPPRRGRTGAWADAMSAIDVQCKTGEVTAFINAFGSKEEVSSVFSKAVSVSRETAIYSIKKFWEKNIGELTAETPSKDINCMASHWLRYQTIAARLMARCGLYQTSGAFGFRDQLQDSMIFLHYAPERTEAQLKLHLAHQFEKGNVLHWWHPETNTGITENCSDDYLWPIMTASELYHETGRTKFLDEKIEFMDSAPMPIWDHLRLSVDRAWVRRSERGLPLLGACDWNDGLSSAGDKGRGESVWVGHFYHILLLEMAELARARGEDPLEYLERAKVIRQAVNEHGWDGEWFIQGTNDEGKLIGSNQCMEGKIHLNPQTWSIIGRTAVEDESSSVENIASELKFSERAYKAIESVKKHLLVEWGVLLLSPAYSTPDESIGYITRYAPGARENGGVYTHGAIWTARAARMIRDRELLHQVIFSLLPPVRGRDPRYFAEPYVTPGNIDGPITPTPGKGGWTWYTGSSGWLERIIFEDLFGIRAMPEGLILDPMVPDEWNSFKVVRPWRGKKLHLNFVRGNEPGISVLKKEIGGKFLSFASLPDSNEFEVTVRFV